MLNANPLLDKLHQMRKLLDAENQDRIEALSILNDNINKLQNEYSSLLIDYIRESKLLKYVTWKLHYSVPQNGYSGEITLREVDWKIDIKSELKDLAQHEYSTWIRLLYGDDIWESFITLRLPDEDSEPPYIEVANIEHLAPFLADYELDVDLTDLQKLIDAKSAEVALLNQIKQAIPN